MKYAYYKKGGKYITATEAFKILEKDISAVFLYSKNSVAEMFPRSGFIDRNGKIVSDHFVLYELEHYSKRANYDRIKEELQVIIERDSKGKSEWHRLCQDIALERNDIDIEVKFTEGKLHYADAVYLNDIVFEYQHSPISKEEFDERTEYYTKQGYIVIWLFDFSSREVTDLDNEEYYQIYLGKYSWFFDIAIEGKLSKAYVFICDSKNMVYRVKCFHPVNKNNKHCHLFKFPKDDKWKPFNDIKHFTNGTIKRYVSNKQKYFKNKTN